MSQQMTCRKRSGRTLRLCRFSLFAIATCVVATSLTSIASAQIIDCPASLKAYAITNPELHCTCASATSMPNCSRGGSSGIVSSGLTSKQMMQQQVANTVVNAFMNMLFSNDTQANAQKQKMLAELEARKAAAEHQKQIEEAMRLAAICKQLQGTLKLSGTPQLALKTDASASSGGLQLKFGDARAAETQNCENKYLNGVSFYALPPGKLESMGQKPCGHSTETRTPSGGGLGLKMGDSVDTPSAVTQAATADPRAMTPQQLADLAQHLTPEEQQQLSNAFQAAQSDAVETRISQTTTASTTPAPTTTETSTVQQPASAGASQASGSALGQLQQTAASSKAAVQADSAEAMAAQAQSGFDTAGAGVVDLRGADPSKPAVVASWKEPAQSAPTTGTSQQTVIPKGATSIPTTPPHPHDDASGTINIAKGTPIEFSPTPTPPPSRIPQMSNEELRAQTCRAREMLTDIGRDSMRDSKEMDAMAKELEETKKEAVLAGAGCFSEMLEKYVDGFMEKKQEEYDKEHPNPAPENTKQYKDTIQKVRDIQKDINTTSVGYYESKKTKDEKLDAALGYLTGLYKFIHEGKTVPWIATAKCMIDFGYIAGKIAVQQQQIEIMNNNLGGKSTAGELKAESSVAAFHKKLVDESLHRGMNPKTFCGE